jgi:hypothetical protein
MNIFRSLSIVIIMFCFSCDKALPVLEGIDAVKWKEDKNGCKQVRSSMKKAVDREKEKLLSLNQMQVVKLLGLPDQNELSTRNQKFFFYFLEPGPACENGNPSAERLSIRFNAVGLAKEVAIDRR